MTAGMAAACGAALRLPVSTVVLVVLMVDNAETVPEIVLAVVVSFVTTELLPQGPGIPAFRPQVGRERRPTPSPPRARFGPCRRSMGVAVRTVVETTGHQDATPGPDFGRRPAARMYRLTTRAHMGKSSSDQAMLPVRRSSVRATR